MAEYIDKGWALATACSGLTREIEGERWIRVDEVRASLNAAPTIEAKPIKHGRWSKEMVCYEDENDYFRFGYQCSQCKAILNKTKRCGECGAIMDLDEVEE